MGRRLPQGVSYWTGIWDPGREAISKEVQTIRDRLSPGATVVSMASGQCPALKPAERVIKLSARQWPLLRVLAAGLERRSRVTHVFGEMQAWHLLRALGRRPIIFTVVIPGSPLPSALLAKVSLFVAESEPIARTLVASGVNHDRIRIIYPGVDLTRFSPSEGRRERFTVVFASCPASSGEFDARGIPLLIEAARRCPQIDLHLWWRLWGNLDSLQRSMAALDPPANVISHWTDVDDMARVFRSAHAVAFLPAENYGKACPQSVVEALACGCPAVVSEWCGIAELLATTGAGVIVARDPDSVAKALTTLPAEFASRSRAARAVATMHFDSRTWIASYEKIYAGVAST